MGSWGTYCTGDDGLSFRVTRVLCTTSAEGDTRRRLTADISLGMAFRACLLANHAIIVSYWSRSCEQSDQRISSHRISYTAGEPNSEKCTYRWEFIFASYSSLGMCNFLVSWRRRGCLPHVVTCFSRRVLNKGLFWLQIQVWSWAMDLGTTFYT